MALVNLWRADRSQITDKRIQQLIAFAGEGKLRDGNNTSDELRDLLSIAPGNLDVTNRLLGAEESIAIV